MATTDDARPAEPTIEQIAEDLSLSNEEGTSWFGYRLHPHEPGTILMDLYTVEGEIEQTFPITVIVGQPFRTVVIS